MDTRDIARRILEIVPGLGIALGPLTGGASIPIGMAIGALTRALGLTQDSTPEKIVEAMNTDPEVRLKLLLADNDFNLRKRDQDIDELRTYLLDMKSARDRDVSIRQAGQTNRRADIMLVSAFLAIIVITIVLAMTTISSSSAIGGFLITIGGMFARNIGTAFDFEFGSSRSSLEKTELLARAQALP
jgi:hypothetical protein